MSTIFTVGDTQPPLAGSVETPLPAGAAAVVHVRRPSGTIVTGNVTIDPVNRRRWAYQWGVGDLTEAGTHRVELQVTHPDLEPQTFGDIPEVTFEVRGQIL